MSCENWVSRNQKSKIFAWIIRNMGWRRVFSKVCWSGKNVSARKLLPKNCVTFFMRHAARKLWKSLENEGMFVEISLYYYYHLYSRFGCIWSKIKHFRFNVVSTLELHWYLSTDVNSVMTIVVYKRFLVFDEVRCASLKPKSVKKKWCCKSKV